MPDALRDNKIDGYFYMVGHPTANIKDASTSVDVKITPIEGANVDSLIKNIHILQKQMFLVDYIQVMMNQLQHLE